MTQMQAEPKLHTQTKVRTVKKEEAPNIPSYYANSVDILVSVYDFVLTLGQMHPTGPDSVVIEQQARVIMSPQHLKTLTKVLADRVAQYESAYGPIPAAPNEPEQPSSRSRSALPA